MHKYRESEIKQYAWAWILTYPQFKNQIKNFNRIQKICGVE